MTFKRRFSYIIDNRQCFASFGRCWNQHPIDRFLLDLYAFLHAYDSQT